MTAMAEKLARKVLRSFGYDIGKVGAVRAAYDFEDEAREKISLVLDHTMLSYECLVTLYQQARHCETTGLPGSYVECGVWKGGAVALMALANLAHGAGRRHLHLFDAFDDICEPDPAIDGERAISEAEQWADVRREELSGKLAPLSGIYAHRGGPGSIGEVHALLCGTVGYDDEFVHYHKGWFQETLPALDKVPDISEIAILRLDADWYASTKICLERLYERVVPGGIVIIDDYGAYDGCRKAVDEFREARAIKALLNHVNADCRYWIKP